MTVLASFFAAILTIWLTNILATFSNTSATLDYPTFSSLTMFFNTSHFDFSSFSFVTTIPAIFYTTIVTICITNILTTFFDTSCIDVSTFRFPTAFLNTSCIDLSAFAILTTILAIFFTAILTNILPTFVATSCIDFPTFGFFTTNLTSRFVEPLLHSLTATFRTAIVSSIGGTFTAFLTASHQKTVLLTYSRTSAIVFSTQHFAIFLTNTPSHGDIPSIVRSFPARLITHTFLPTIRTDFSTSLTSFHLTLATAFVRGNQTPLVFANRSSHVHFSTFTPFA
uniref:G-protein coupled receptors family 1 profile domain-containing protein n=1 Tax=Anopheles atroparvus TaxID=41427 RepID=A0AAG5DJZ9_ANOAO